MDESPQIREKLFHRQRVRSKEAPANDVQYDVAALNPFPRGGKSTNPYINDYESNLADYIGMKGRPHLMLESSILGTHVFDVTRGKIRLPLRVDCVAGTYFAFTRAVDDEDETIRDLFQKALCEPGRIVWIRGHDREEVVLDDTPPCRICEEWGFLIGWRNAAQTRVQVCVFMTERQYLPVA